MNGKKYPEITITWSAQTYRGPKGRLLGCDGMSQDGDECNKSVNCIVGVVQ